MPSSLRQALDIIRENSSSDAEMGTKFEKLSKIFLEHDATQAQQFSQVWHYSDWAQRPSNAASLHASQGGGCGG